MTNASQQALEGLRDLTTLKWYVIPLLAIVANAVCLGFLRWTY